MKRSQRARPSGNGWRYGGRAALTVCCAALTGCGLADYQERMDGEQQRMDYILNENRALQGPVELPRPKDATEKLPDVFFRPPKGISRAPAEEAKFFPYVYYPRTAVSLFDAVLVYVSSASPDDFWREVVRPFPGLSQPAFKPEPEPLKPLDRKPMNFDTVQGANYSVYVHQAEQGRVAIAFLLPVGVAESEEIRTQKRYSLASLVVGGDAVKRKAYFPAETPTKPSAKREAVP
jgi:hypothetical protein